MSGERVLVVDDEKYICEIISRRLAAESLEVETVCDPREAIRMLDRQYDLVFTDIHMPAIDGEELFKHIRRALPNAAVIVVTGMPETKQAVRMLRHGADDYLVKPLDLDELVISARRVLTTRQLSAENERYRLELERRVKELALAQRERQDLWNMAVHDLKNPIAQVMGRVELLADRAGDRLADADLRDLDLCHDGCKRMLRLVTNLLDISKLENSTMTVSLGRLDLNELVSAAAENWAPAAKREGLDLSVAVAVEPPHVMADRRLIERVLDNLLANAVEHAHDGGWIHLRTMPPGEAGEGAFAVEDGGPGIPPELREKIFERYFSTSGGGGDSSSVRGLGLAFCKAAVESQGGRIGVLDGESGGSVFRVALPLIDRSREELHEAVISA